MDDFYSEIVNRSTREEMIEAVRRYLAEGWAPCGDPLASRVELQNPDGTPTWRIEYFQRFIRKA
jgi:hypothetical protein